MCHTILLMQMNPRAESRIFFEYETIEDCMNSICRIYVKSQQCCDEEDCGIDILELYNFLDDFKDIVCLVQAKESNTYVPHNKKWIKEELYKLLVPRECV